MSPTLFELWNSQDDKHLAKNPISIRLPVHIFARLQALSELYPGKSRNDIVIDLLKEGIKAFENSLPKLSYDLLDVDDDDGIEHTIRNPSGFRADYYRTANKYYREIETELGVKKITDLFNVSAEKVK